MEEILRCGSRDRLTARKRLQQFVLRAAWIEACAFAGRQQDSDELSCVIFFH